MMMSIIAINTSRQIHNETSKKRGHYESTIQNESTVKKKFGV